MIFFTSDTHFGHKGIIRFQRPQFSSTEEMDRYLINRWNVIVGPKDIVYHAGDFGFGNSSYLDQIVAALHGRIHLILGNHDHRGKVFSKVTKLRFESIQSFLELKISGAPRITICHYPMLVWNQSHYGSWHLHGHSHGSCKAPGLRWDVGVDCNDYLPISIDDLHDKMKNGTISYADYHKQQEQIS